jgi:hypothetical protein
VGAYPKPDQPFWSFHGKRSMISSNPCRPVTTDLLKMQGRVVRGGIQYVETSIGEFARFCREPMIMLPELGEAKCFTAQYNGPDETVQ